MSSSLVYKPCTKTNKIWLALSLIPALKRKQLIATLTYANYVLADAWDCLLDNHFQRLNGFSQQLCQQLRCPPQKLINQALSWSQDPGHHLITWDHPAFPQYLWQISSPPLLLYLKGDPQVLQYPQLAVVGSRKPTPIAQELAVQLCCDLAAAGYTITSGLASGIDTCAHQGALLSAAEYGVSAGLALSAAPADSKPALPSLATPGRTLAVLGSGIDRVYPASNCSLAEQIINRGGALISEFPLSAPPKRQHFPQRNRIVTGLALGTLVMEAGLKSGSLISARYTLEQNRDLMVVPTFPGNPQTAGGLQLLKDGAHPIACAQDVINILAAKSWPQWLQPGAENNTVAAQSCLSQSPIGNQSITGINGSPLSNSKHKASCVTIAAKPAGDRNLDAQSLDLLSCFDNHCISAEHLISRSNLTPSQFHVSLQLLQQRGYVCHKASGYQKLANNLM